jgi:hypothetical protein
MRFPLILVLTLALGFVLANIVGLILAAVLLLIGYMVSIRRHPRIAHRSCGGTGRSHGWLYTWTHHRCQGCSGSGRAIRYGAARWGAPAIRQEAERAARIRAQAKQSSAWR